jgi:hypothetical protein
MSGSELTPELARLLRVWVPGARCVAAMDIVYGASDLEVEKGAKGTVMRVLVSRVLLIRWDKSTRAEVIATSPGAVDPLVEALSS